VPYTENGSTNMFPIADELASIKQFLVQSGGEICHPCHQLKDELTAMAFRNYRSLIGCLIALIMTVIILCHYRKNASWKPRRKTASASTSRKTKEPLSLLTETDFQPLPQQQTPIKSMEIGVKFTKKMVGRTIRIQWPSSESNPVLIAKVTRVLNATKVKVQYLEDGLFEIVDTKEQRIQLLWKRSRFSTPRRKNKKIQHTQLTAASLWRINLYLKQKRLWHLKNNTTQV